MFLEEVLIAQGKGDLHVGIVLVIEVSDEDQGGNPLMVRSISPSKASRVAWRIRSTLVLFPKETDYEGGCPDEYRPHAGISCSPPGSGWGLKAGELAWISELET
jgi:hypothetical protein